MTGGTISDKEKRPIKLLVVGHPAEYSALAMARLIANRNYEVTFITPREAKQFPTLKPHDGILPLKNIIPEVHQYYPHSAVEPNRRQRRKKLRHKLKRNGK